MSSGAGSDVDVQGAEARKEQWGGFLAAGRSRSRRAAARKSAVAAVRSARSCEVVARVNAPASGKRRSGESLVTAATRLIPATRISSDYMSAPTPDSSKILQPKPYHLGATTNW